MQIIKQNELNISDVVDQLKAGKTLVYPTETCYGLGCDATNQSVVDKIFEIKQRPKDKSVLVIVPDVAIAKEYIEWNETIEKLARRYWPGPLTIVADVKSESGLATGVVAENGTVAFRVTDHPLASALAKGLGQPLVSTSANIASFPSPYSFADVLKMFAKQKYQPDIAIDAGELLSKNLSTIVRVEEGSVEVLRQGVLVISLKS